MTSNDYSGKVKHPRPVVGIFLIILSVFPIMFLGGCASTNDITKWRPCANTLEQPLRQLPFRVGLETIVDRRAGQQKGKTPYSDDVTTEELAYRAQVERLKRLGNMIGSYIPGPDPFWGPLGETLTNELYYNFIKTNTFTSVERWFEPDSVDFILRGEISEFTSIDKTITSLYGTLTMCVFSEIPLLLYLGYNEALFGIPLLFVPNGRKNVDISLVFHVINPKTGDEIATYKEEKHIRKFKAWYSPKKNFTDRVIRDLFQDLIHHLSRDSQKISSAL